MTDLDPTLLRLADAYGIATHYSDWQGQPVEVARETVVAVLAGLGVDAHTSEAAAQALEARRLEPSSRMLPPCLVIRQRRPQPVPVHMQGAGPLTAWIELETGGLRGELTHTAPTTTRGATTGPTDTPAPTVVDLPDDLPLGYHTLRVRCPGHDAAMPLIVTPDWLGLPARLEGRRAWGLAAQLYSVRSAQSWGVGDLTDLTDLAVWSAAEHAADYVLVNPLHAAEPVAPMEPSPYLPTSRRFANPLYLRIEHIPEYATADASTRDQLQGHRERLWAELAGRDTVDRDRTWTAKRAALRAVFAVPRTPGRALSLAAYRRREGQGLRDFAVWSAIAVEHGADFGRWPAELRHPANPAVHAYAQVHAEEVDFQAWLQWQLDEQLDATQRAAQRAGMALGVMHDLAVGVHPAGADAWSLADSYAHGISVGAPPDAYNQHGQDWSQPPWRPDRLAQTAYAPYRAMVSTLLRHAGGIRVDHVIGLFRLWWIPAGAGPKQGTYVRYDHEAMIGILALEAHRAEAVVVGEDLGTVEPRVRTYLAQRGIFGTSILWFERDYAGDGAPIPPPDWREYCLASVTTHDLPPTTAYLAGDHVRLRERLGVLTRPLDEELALAREERADWIAALRARGMLTAPVDEQGADGQGPDEEGAEEEEMVLALHRFLSRTPARLLNVALTDAVGDRRAQNQPGTSNEYPNWRVPLTDAQGGLVGLEGVFTSARVERLLRVFGREPAG